MRGGRAALDVTIADVACDVDDFIIEVAADVMAELVAPFGRHFAAAGTRYLGWTVIEREGIAPGGWRLRSYNLMQTLACAPLGRPEALPIETLRVRNGSGYGWQWHNPHDACEYPGPTPDQFALGESDYDVGSDELICPCGHIQQRGETLGEMLDQAQTHLDEAHGGGWRG